MSLLKSYIEASFLIHLLYKNLCLIKNHCIVPQNLIEISEITNVKILQASFGNFNMDIGCMLLNLFYFYLNTLLLKSICIKLLTQICATLQMCMKLIFLCEYRHSSNLISVLKIKKEEILVISFLKNYLIPM